MKSFSLYPQDQQHTSVASRIVSVLFLLLILLGGGLWVVHKTGNGFASVQSASMTPRIGVGDLAITSPASFSSLKTGDIVTYEDPRRAGRTITHRIININEQHRSVTTKGDANPTSDKPIAASRILGRVDHTVAKLGFAIDFIRNPIGLLIIIYVPAFLIILSELRRLAAYYKSIEIYQLPGWKPRENPAITINTMKAGAMLALLAPFAISSSVGAALADTATMTGNRASTAIMQYKICNFPDNEALLSYAAMDAYFPELPGKPLQLAQPILPGNYRVSAVSTDDHIANPNEPSQPNERWFAELYGSTGQKVTDIGVTNDLPDDEDELTSVTNENLHIATTIYGIRYIHNAARTGLEQDNFGGRRYDDLTWAEKRQVLWNSIHPGCITFDRIDNPE